MSQTAAERKTFLTCILTLRKNKKTEKDGWIRASEKLRKPKVTL